MGLDLQLVDENKIEERDYQLNIFDHIKDHNSLVVLPTGLGKTVIAVYLLAYKLEEKEDSIVIFMAPSRPLCSQHRDFILEMTRLEEEQVRLITGELYSSEEREELWKERTEVYVATPQVVNNDLHNISVSDVDTVIFDEAHRTVKDYAYVDIAKALKHRSQFLGMTASPGSSFEKLVEVAHNLDIEKVSVRKESDEDVARYISDKNIDWIELEKNDEIQKMESWLNDILKDQLEELTKYSTKAYAVDPKNAGKMELIEIQDDLQKKIKSEGKKGYLFHALSLIASAIKTAHLKEVLVSQGIDSAYSYVLSLNDDDSRAASYLKKREEFDRLNDKLMDLKAMPVELNPKLGKTKSILREELEKKKDTRCMVFAEYRDTVAFLKRELNKMDEIKAEKLIGQSDREGDKGMDQEEQKDVLHDFREGEYNVLVSTSIGEEGLDVPSTSLVIFYEPVASAIRSIQRKGRTGRDNMPGKVKIMITEESKDVAYYWKSKQGEDKMLKHVYRLKEEIDKAREPKKRIKELYDKYKSEQSALSSF